jgi:hypothetical protein
MRVRANEILMGLCIVVGLAFPTLAQEARSPCDSFIKNGDGDWIATRDVTVPGPSGPVEVKDGNRANDELRDRLDTLCR